MKKLLFSFLMLGTSFLTLKAQTYYSRQAGSWADNTAVWSTVSQTGSACACSPGNSVSSTTMVYIYNNISSFGALSSLSNSGKIVIESGDSAIITTSTLSMSGSANITVNSGGVLVINGALNMVGSSSITNNGIMVVYGNISNSGSATVTDNGDLTVHGNVSTNGSASFTGTGTSYVIGKVSGSGTSMLSVLPGFFSSFGSATGNGLIQYQTSPILSFSPLQFNGNANSVLTGNGTFANFSAISPWVQSGSNIYYNAGNVGIGTSNPTAPLEVNGNVIANGNVFANNVLAANNISVGSFRIVNGAIDSFVSTATQMQVVTNNLSANNAITAGTTVTAGTTLVAGATGPSTIRIDGNAGTITSPSGNISFGNNNIATMGTLSAGAFNVNNLNVVDSLKTPVVIASHIKPMPGDSIVHIGDSSFLFYTKGIFQGNIYFDGLPGPSFSCGLGLGNQFTYSTALQFAVGWNNKLSNGQNIVIGSGITNNIRKSIMLGFSQPAIFIDGNNNVGIGTTAPGALLDIEQPSTPATGLKVQSPAAHFAYGLINTVDATNYYDVKAMAVYDLSSNTDKFVVNGNGSAYFASAINFGNDPTLAWTTTTSSPYQKATASGSWNVPIIMPNGSAIRTASTGALGKYLGFGMVDGPTLASTTGWYWMVEGTKDNTSTACYPMTLILDNGGVATLTVSQNGWCDYVFDPTYKVMSIEEKEKYYIANKHLPDIDPANVVQEKGLNINKNMKGMLKNIEEDRIDITALYKLIQQQTEKIEELENQIKEMKRINN